MFASRARLLEDRLVGLAARIREIRGLMLVDRGGLVLVSTLGGGGFEEALAAFTAAGFVQLDRAREDFETGPTHLLHVAGRDRQILSTPLTGDVALVAVVDGGANAATVTIHLLATAREILEFVRVSEMVTETEGKHP